MSATKVKRINGARFELRYRSLSPLHCGYAFPCDRQGNVDLDQLSERARDNYLFARTVVGRDYEVPVVVAAAENG